MPYRNPWTGIDDSPIDYSKPAKELAADACMHATAGLCGKLHITDQAIVDAIVDNAYVRAVRTVSSWDTSYPFYNHCWNCVRSVYPEVLRKANSTRTEAIESYDDVMEKLPSYTNGTEKSERDLFEESVEEAREIGISPMYTSYGDYMRQRKAEAVRRMVSRRSGTPRSPSDG